MDHTRFAHPLISVVIPCYNHAPYVVDCINSVLQQTYRSVEILVFDDGSKDGSAEIIAPLATQYGFFFRAQKNQGLPRTLNDALAICKGEFIAPFASDDVMFPDRLQKQIAFVCDKPDVAIVSGQVTRIDEYGNVYSKQAEHSRILHYMSFDDLFIGKGVHPAAPTMLYRRSAIEQVGGFRPDIAIEDLYMQLKLTHAGWKIADMPDMLAYYRVHSSNTMRNVKFLYDNIGKIYDEYKDHPLYARVRRKYLNGMLLRAAGVDKSLAQQIWQDMRWSDINIKTLRALWRLHMQHDGESRV